MTDQESTPILTNAIQKLLDINLGLSIFMPETTQTIAQKFKQHTINPFTEGLFKRL